MDILLTKVFRVIEAMAGSGEPRGINELARELELPPSNIHRILRSLVNLGYAAQEAETRGYQLTPRLFELGGPHRVLLDLKAVARPVMERLSRNTGETVALAVLDGTDLVYLDYVEGPQQLRLTLNVGHRIPSYCAAAGRAILAFRPDGADLLQRMQPEAFTPRTLTSLTALARRLEAVRRTGSAIVTGERHILINAVAAPILDRPGHASAAISLIGTSDRLQPATLREMAPQVISAANAIAAARGADLRATQVRP